MADQQPAPPPDPYPGNVYLNRRKNLAELRAKYPLQFPREDMYYFWPDGWHWLAAGACSVMFKAAPDGAWDQIKEKRGELRLYGASGPLCIDVRTPDESFSLRADLVDKSPDSFDLNTLLARLEATSRTTCCLCGGKNGIGKLVEHSAWLHVACETCEPLIREFRNLSGRI